jgi:hypothetical protein
MEAMSWSDDTRCLYCDGKLPLYRKLTNGQFCSTGHQKSYWKEQERLAVEVLHRTHDALMAFRPAQDVELIIGPAVGWNGQTPEAPPAQEPVRPEPVAPRVEPRGELRVEQRVERPAERVERRAEPVYETARPVAQAPPAAQAPATPEPEIPSFADFIQGSPEGLAPSWTVLPLMQAVEPVQEEPAFLDLIIRDAGERVLETPVRQLAVEEHPVPVGMHAAGGEWTFADIIPIAIAIRPGGPLVLPSDLEPVLEPELAFSQGMALIEPEMETEPSTLERYEPEPVALEPLAFEQAAQPFSFAEPAEQVVSTEPVVVIERGLLERLAVPESDRVFLQGNSAIVPEAPLAAPAIDLPSGTETALVAELAHVPEVVEQTEAETAEDADSGPIPPFAGWQHREATFATAWSATASIAAKDSGETEFSLSTVEKPVLAVPALQTFSSGLGAPVELSLKRPEAAPQPRPAILTWFRLGAFNPPLLIESSLNGTEPHVGLAGGCRYAMKGLTPALPANAAEAMSFGVDRRFMEFPELAPAERQAAQQTNLAPDFAELTNLSKWKPELSARPNSKSPVRKSAAELMAFSAPVWIPALRLQPLRWVSALPLAPLSVEEAPKPVAAAAPEAAAPPKEHPQLGHLLMGFWKNAPRDLRLLVFAIPALLALAFHPTLPKVHVSTVQATEPVQKNVGQAVNGSWNSFKQVVSERAAVQLDEDFRSGLDDWSSPGGTATEWSFDANGFVRPGSLALYSPSLSLADYEAQFLAIIDQKALSWVVRAEDFSNYYVIKLVVLKPGPLTTLGLTRYAVINGKPQNRVDAVVPFTARPDMIYRVRMDIHDDSFVLAIQGQIVDAWSEPRLKKGGIGFYSARGEESRVRWLQVSHQYDMLGRLCSYLAPYDLSATSFMPTESPTKNSSTKDNGSWQR